MGILNQENIKPCVRCIDVHRVGKVPCPCSCHNKYDGELYY